jgi:predicted RNase H-like nuclease (RuvC/YqgF family)
VEIGSWISQIFQDSCRASYEASKCRIINGHDSGISESYWRPTEKDVLADYLKAVPLLTINYDNDKTTLQKQVKELTEKSEEENYIIKGKLAEKEKELEALKARFEDLDTLCEIVNKKAASVDETYNRMMELHDKWQQKGELLGILLPRYRLTKEEADYRIKKELTTEELENCK